MKQIFLLAALALVPGAQAVELNKDAMKTMQQKGHEIVEQEKAKEQAQKSRPWKAGNNLCLEPANGGLVIRQCNAQSMAQKWTQDGKGRLVAHNGRCVAAGAKMAKCGDGKGQKWKHDGNKRLANANNQCLQVQGNQAKAGTKVIQAACGNAKGQVWK